MIGGLKITKITEGLWGQPARYFEGLRLRLAVSTTYGTWRRFTSPRLQHISTRLPRILPERRFVYQKIH